MLIDSVGKPPQEANYWFAASNFCGALGLLLRPLFPLASPIVIVVIPNLLLFLELTLLNKAIADFVERGRSLWLGFLVLSLVITAASAWTVLWHPNRTLLGWYISAVTISTAAASAALLFRFAIPGIKLPVSSVAAFFAVYSVHNLLRLFHDWTDPRARFYHILFDRTILAGLSVSYLLMTDARLRERLERQAGVDPLTGVLNRRAFERKAVLAIAEAHRAGRPLSGLMLDIDRFKQINDRFGHDAGDRALQALADIMRQSARANDLIVRLGGDEFFLLLSGISPSRAASIARRIHALLAASPVSVDDATFHVQASIGIVAYGATDLKLDDLIKLGDRTLYAAKAAREGAEPQRSDSLGGLG